MDDEKLIVDEEEEEELNDEEDEKKTVKGDLHYRYVCPACTGNAYYAEDILEEHLQSNCRNCGAGLGGVEKESFIPLTDDQKESLRILGK